MRKNKSLRGFVNRSKTAAIDRNWKDLMVVCLHFPNNRISLAQHLISAHRSIVEKVHNSLIKEDAV